MEMPNVLAQNIIPDEAGSTSDDAWQPEWDYEYVKLEAPGVIRILELQPAPHPEDQLEGNFVLVQLAEKPIFEALSYTWGKPVFSKSIFIDGGKLPITQNLANALRHLRHKDRVRQLWIDACCINQHDNAEKTEQLQLMAEIYKTAVKVLAWLGKSTEDTREAIALTRQLAATTGSIDFTDGTFSIAGVVRKYIDLDASKEEVAEAAHLWAEVLNNKALRDIFHRSWFTRLWVVQEMILASDLVFLLGAFELKLDTFISGFVGYMSLHDALAIGSIGSDMINQVWEFIMLRKKYYDTPNISHDSPYMQYRIFKDRVKSKDCHDPRDQIFALFGICPGLQEQTSELLSSLFTSIGYHRTVAQTFRDFSRCFLSQNDVDCLHDAGLWKRYMASEAEDAPHTFSPCQDPNDENYLPSWAPDLSKASENVFTFWYTHDETLCAGGSPDIAEVLVLPEYPSLILAKGVLLGTIQKTVESSGGLSILDSTCQAAEEVHALHQSLGRYDNSDSEVREFASFLMADGYTPILRGMLGGLLVRDLDENDFHQLWLNFEDKCLEKTTQLYAQWKSHEEAYGKVDAALINTASTLDERYAMAYLLTLRFLFNKHVIVATDKGTIAMAPIGARKGDFLAVIAGMRVPVLLTTSHTGLLVLGACYGKGMMKGESCPKADSDWRYLLLV